MDELKLKHETITIKALIEDYRSGRILVPEFQRDYVWRKSKAPKLIDSLYRGYPISSILLWESSERIETRHRTSRHTRTGVSWLIDGQQRVTILAKTMSGEEEIDVVFNPDDDEFRLANPATNNDPTWLHVAHLWDEELFRQTRRNLDGDGKNADRREKTLDRVRRILDYQIPLVRMVDHGFDAAVDTFSRINTLGVRLNKADIESAKVAARHIGFIKEELTPFLERIKKGGFTRMNVMHLFRACAFVARPDGRSRTPLHELEKKEVLSAWKSTQRATEDAIGLVRSELGLVNMDILWSGAFIVPMIALCHVQGPRQRDARGMIGWLALAALLHRYSGSSETALDQDLRECRGQDPIGGLLSNLRQTRPKLEAYPDDFGGSLADRSGLLALYVACMNRGILDFYTGGRILLQSGIDRHHILPRSQFPADQRSISDCIANIAFINGGSNKSISMTGPEIYLKSIPRKTLRSQCIPEDSSLWNINSYDDFWSRRRELLAESFNEFLRSYLPGRRL